MHLNGAILLVRQPAQGVLQIEHAFDSGTAKGSDRRFSNTLGIAHPLQPRELAAERMDQALDLAFCVVMLVRIKARVRRLSDKSLQFCRRNKDRRSHRVDDLLKIALRGTDRGGYLAQRRFTPQLLLEPLSSACRA